MNTSMLLSTRACRLGLAMIASTLIVACTPARMNQTPRQLDLGTGSGVLNKIALQRHVPVVVPEASAPASLSDLGLIWRMGVTGQPQTYATYQWSASPAKLVTQRITDRLALHGAVLAQSINAELPQIRLNLRRFEHDFALDGSSSVGALTLQAVFVKGGQVIDEKWIDVQITAESQDAPGGAEALRKATDQAAEQLANWSSQFLNP